MKIRILTWLLKRFAQMMVWRYKPAIVGITGTVGKTSTKEAVRAILGKDRYVRASAGNFNNEIGLPLAILGGWQKLGGFFFWTKVFLVAVFKIIFKFGYPKVLVLEYAADRPGDIKYLLSIARPQTAVLTAVGDIPVHVEFYAGPEAVAKEKARLIEQLPAVGFAVLNADDKTLIGFKEQTRAHLMTFGFEKGADVQITGFENRFDGKTGGIFFKLEHAGSFVPVRLNGVFGRSQAYAAAAGACVGLIFGMNLVKISEALGDYEPPPQRMRFLPGVKGAYIIDDSYNASPLSMHAALDTLNELKADRKVAVLGDMLEIGKYAPEAHEEMGWLAAKIVDVLVTVGPRAKFIAKAAGEGGLDYKNILSFDNADEAKKEVQRIIKKGDLILIKSSRAIKLDKVVEEIKKI